MFRKTDLLHMICLSALLSGCQGIPLKEIRNRPTIKEYTTAQSINSVTACLTQNPSLEKLLERFKVLTYPDGEKTELSLGAIQMGTFKKYYLITLERATSFSVVSLKRSPANFPLLGEADLKAIIASCI
ncbi:MAG: hypothetical protein DI586_03570 [Micavibrio aeruginosavorus]|uniref:Lipoprotein n=1 Tax=Micavibrio aeruginosavorus TaxID=349221 RepID=A0A2W5HLC2_9BACT|nr:MAG: hypothetical protein DI586_03570 [Micavibrio aeruginosavorus]